jgi:hypothetical protein
MKALPVAAGHAEDDSRVAWTAEQIRALGATTDLPTLGSIFGASRWKTYEMARTGGWQVIGVKVVRLGSKYRVIVHSILEVLGFIAIPSATDGTSQPDLPAATQQVGHQSTNGGEDCHEAVQGMLVP